MSRFVLVHGAWHGGWCWERVTPLLEARGHQVIAPDLPAMGADLTDARGITLESWAGFVVELLRASAEAAILVGHSRAGVVISRAAELAPRSIRRLVYLSAYLLTAGDTVADAARADADSLVSPNMLPARAGLTCSLRPSVVRDAFYGRCTAADAAEAAARLTSEPLKPLVTPLDITEEGFGSVPRAYIQCSADRAVTPAAQRLMQQALPCDPVFTLDSDHSPFLGCPAALAELLERL
jgi:pimeloyl-ACP methyl ester carboxylesterase